MSTRATYSFDKEHTGKATFYIHHDGYPEGAALYFNNLLQHKSTDEMVTRRLSVNSLYLLAERFLRANENAEITGSHAAHGDTDYRYSVNKNGIVKAEKKIRGNDKDEWLAIFKGTIPAFVAEYMEADETAAPKAKPAAAMAAAAVAKAAKPAKAKAAPKATKAAATPAARLAAAMAAALA